MGSWADGEKVYSPRGRLPRLLLAAVRVVLSLVSGSEWESTRGRLREEDSCGGCWCAAEVAGKFGG